jgi:dihydrofolate reductase
MINAIFAVDSLGGLGKNGSLPWPKNSEDLRWFKKNTLGHIVVMGGNTWRDPLMPKPLPGRTNVVITSQPIDTEGVIVYNKHITQSIQHLQYTNPYKDVFIIGGASLLTSTWDIVNRVVLTQFSDSYDCDVSMDLDVCLGNFTMAEQTQTDNGRYSIWNKNTYTH